MGVLGADVGVFVVTYVSLMLMTKMKSVGAGLWWIHPTAGNHSRFE